MNDQMLQNVIYKMQHLEELLKRNDDETFKIELEIYYKRIMELRKMKMI